MPTPSSQGAAGSQSMPADSQERASNGEQVFGSGTRDSSTGELGGDNRASKRVFGDSGGDYTLDTLPNSVFGGGISSGDEKPMTSAERAKVLDERLRKGYETFDGFILSERERAQNESNAAGSAQPGADAGGAGGAGLEEAPARAERARYQGSGGGDRRGVREDEEVASAARSGAVGVRGASGGVFFW